VSTTKSRLVAAASTAAIAGSVLVAAPLTAAPAQAAGATTHIKFDSMDQANKIRDRIVKVAKNQVGERYITGATGPGAFDCSGLVVYSYKTVTHKTLPRTSYSQHSAIKGIRAKNRRPGDLVFFHGNGHVAIYIGHNKIVHASNPRRGVRIDTISGWYRGTLVGYGRVIQSK
jgi:cell wall-associated NlpC family hydrolase